MQGLTCEFWELVVVLINSLDYLRDKHDQPRQVANIQTVQLFQNFQKDQVESANKHPIEYIGPFLSIMESYFSETVLQLRRTHIGWIREVIYGQSLFADRRERAGQDHLLFKLWQLTRLTIEDFDLMIEKIGAIQADPALASPKIKAAHERYRTMIARARLLEQHVRDDIQLNVGNLSLQESRKSLQQADNVGRISVLAFIFLPISLVTSFFGMNIKQLTGSGVPWRTFLISARGLCLLVLLTCAWLWRGTIYFWAWKVSIPYRFRFQAWRH